MWYKWKKGILTGAVVVFILPSILSAQMLPVQTSEGQEDNSYTKQYCVTFSQEDIIFNTLLGYDTVQLKDGGYLTDVGKPTLPVKEIKIALPQSIRVTQVLIVDVQRVALEGTFMIFPAQPPKRTSDNTELSFIEPEMTVYTSDQLYPSSVVEFIGHTDLAGQGMAVIRLTPVQYIPSEKKLFLCTSLTFKVSGTDGYICGDYLSTHISDASKAMVEFNVKDMVINPEDVQLRTPDVPQPIGVPPGDYDYVIITQDSWVTAFQPLALWKTLKGVPATIVTTSWIYNSGGYSGSSVNKLRAFVQDAYTSWGTIYVLLGGDTDVIPCNYRTFYSVDSGSVANDAYYADFDADWVCEVNVGRASVTGPGTGTGGIGNFVNKILTYERNPPMTDYAMNAALFGFDLDGSTPAEQCKIAIDNSYIPASWTMSNVYDSDEGNHRSAVINAVNVGQNLINHADHSNSGSMGTGYVNHDWTISTSTVDNFHNGNKQSIFYSMGCDPAAYDSSNCIGEHFVRDTDGGGVAFVGNSRYGWYNPGYVDTLSMAYDISFFQSLFSQNHYKLGDCFSDHKNDAYLNDAYYKYIYTELTLLGDPELPIWTENPAVFAVTHPSQILIGSSTFAVHVTSEGSPVNQASVCLWKENEVYLTGITNANGDVVFYPAPPTNGDLYVTVTKQNYVPYQSIVIVSAGPNAPYLPSNPSPAKETTGVDVDTNLSWISGDPNGDTVTYDVYLGTSYPPTLRVSDLSTTIYDPGTLSFSTLYYWKVVANDNNGSITYGPTWSFTTVSPIYMRLDSLQGSRGNQYIMYLTGRWTNAIGGYDMAMYYDASKIQITAIDLVGTVADYPTSEWQAFPVYGDGVVAAAAIAFENAPPDDILPAGSGKLFRIVVTIQQDAADGATVLDLDENVLIGSVPYYCSYAPPTGPVIFPELVDGMVTINASAYRCGDVNNDGILNVGDVVYLINYLFRGGDLPVPVLCVGDVNNDDVVDVGDVVSLVNYLFRGGVPFGDQCCT